MRDQPRFRRHEGACPFYRENWLMSDQRPSSKGEITLYEIYCLRETPPETIDEQHTCMLAETACWRDGLAHRTFTMRERRREAKEAAAGVT
jgi:hypothetical protein